MPRAFIRLVGNDRAAFLQGLLTQDMATLGTQRIAFAAMLSAQGKILHDMFLLPVGDAIVLDTQAALAELLLKRLSLYKLRANVGLELLAATDPAIASLGQLPDPRHPALPVRNYANTPTLDPMAASLALGIPALCHDFQPDELTALDAGYDLLHAISFTKGCYVGQEVTARMHYKNIARRGFFILERDGAPERLALLKFEEAAMPNASVTVDNTPYHARLPGWMEPKRALFESAHKNQ